MSALPSYEALAAQLRLSLGREPTQKEIYDAIASHISPPAYSDLTDPESLKILKSAALEAANAAAGVKSMFISLAFSLGQVQIVMGPTLQKDAAEIQGEYEEILKGIKAHSATLSETALEFNNIYLESASDTNETPAARLETLDSFVVDINSQKGTVGGITERLQVVQQRLATLFKRTASETPVAYEKKLQEKIKDLEKEISDNNKEIAEHKKAIIDSPFPPRTLVLVKWLLGGLSTIPLVKPLLADIGKDVDATLKHIEKLEECEGKKAKLEASIDELRQSPTPGQEVAKELNRLASKDYVAIWTRSIGFLDTPVDLLTQDSGEVKSYLSLLEKDPTAQPPEVLKTYMKTHTSVHQSMSVVLDEFSKAL